MTVNSAIYEEMFMPTPGGVRTWLQQARRSISEEGVIDFVARLSPWIAPLPSAFFVHDATLKHLGTGDALAWIIAGVIETLGLTTTHTALSMFTWNKAHPNDKQNHAPFGLAVALAIVYIVSTLVLIAVLEVFPQLQNYAPAMFPVLAAVGAVNLAMRSTHNRRIREEKEAISDGVQRQRQLEDEERALRHEERRMKMAVKYGVTVALPGVTSTVAQPVTSGVAHTGGGHNVTPSATNQRHVSDERQDAILSQLADGTFPGATKSGRQFGVDRKTIYRDLDALEAAGKVQKGSDGAYRVRKAVQP